MDTLKITKGTSSSHSPGTNRISNGGRMTPSYIGIDPGVSGGVAVVGAIIEAHKMPETNRDLLDLLRSIKSRCNVVYALIEELHAMPAAVEEKLGIKRGSVSMWKLGAHYGGLKMALTALEIPFDERVPAVWQKIMSCRTGGDKNVSKAKAQQLFPQIKVTHAIADSLLIASTARIMWLNAHPEEWKKREEIKPVDYPMPEERVLLS